jgi:hypothetical protein
VQLKSSLRIASREKQSSNDNLGRPAQPMASGKNVPRVMALCCPPRYLKCVNVFNDKIKPQRNFEKS